MKQSFTLKLKSVKKDEKGERVIKGEIGGERMRKDEKG
jgi:hypothetical protein